MLGICMCLMDFTFFDEYFNAKYKFHIPNKFTKNRHKFFKKKQKKNKKKTKKRKNSYFRYTLKQDAKIFKNESFDSEKIILPQRFDCRPIYIDLSNDAFLHSNVFKYCCSRTRKINFEKKVFKNPYRIKKVRFQIFRFIKSFEITLSKNNEYFKTSFEEFRRKNSQLAIQNFFYILIKLKKTYQLSLLSFFLILSLIIHNSWLLQTLTIYYLFIAKFLFFNFLYRKHSQNITFKTLNIHSFVSSKFIYSYSYTFFPNELSILLKFPEILNNIHIIKTGLNKTNDEDFFETKTTWFLNNSIIFFITLFENIHLIGLNFFLCLFKFSINNYFCIDIYWLKNKEILLNLTFFWLQNNYKTLIFSTLIIFESIYLKVFELKYFLFIIQHLEKFKIKRFGNLLYYKNF
uniref:Similar to mRNA capping enzyme n=1 Tax=Lotharella vacuolata TaxID=74820 RepID=A0A0H5BHK2_9EUKA|nr:similar to mRNA capping enzyme [Lotharella vacuolata]